MTVFAQTQNYWKLKAKAIAGLDSSDYDEFSAAADYSRSGIVAKLIKPDGSIITYHNGHKI